MTATRRVATWLEIAIAGNEGTSAGRLRTHLLRGAEEGCSVVSLDGRLLHDCEGRITGFHGEEAVERFLALAGSPRAARGAPLDVPVDCGGESKCFRLRRGKLRTCGHAKSAPRAKPGVVAQLLSQSALTDESLVVCTHA